MTSCARAACPPCRHAGQASGRVSEPGFARAGDPPERPRTPAAQHDHHERLDRSQCGNDGILGTPSNHNPE
jgi:hypothetical protein